MEYDRSKTPVAPHTPRSGSTPPPRSISLSPAPSKPPGYGEPNVSCHARRGAGAVGGSSDSICGNAEHSAQGGDAKEQNSSRSRTAASHYDTSGYASLCGLSEVLGNKEHELNRILTSLSSSLVPITASDSFASAAKKISLYTSSCDNVVSFIRDTIQSAQLLKQRNSTSDIMTNSGTGSDVLDVGRSSLASGSNDEVAPHPSGQTQVTAKRRHITLKYAKSCIYEGEVVPVHVKGTGSEAQQTQGCGRYPLFSARSSAISRFSNRRSARVEEYARNGFGTLYYDEKRRFFYRGHWQNDMKDGDGVLSLPTAALQGRWRKNCPRGTVWLQTPSMCGEVSVISTDICREKESTSSSPSPGATTFELSGDSKVEFLNGFRYQGSVTGIAARASKFVVLKENPPRPSIEASTSRVNGTTCDNTDETNVQKPYPCLHFPRGSLLQVGGGEIKKRMSWVTLPDSRKGVLSGDARLGYRVLGETEDDNQRRVEEAPRFYFIGEVNPLSMAPDGWGCEARCAVDDEGNIVFGRYVGFFRDGVPEDTGVALLEGESTEKCKEGRERVCSWVYLGPVHRGQMHGTGTYWCRCTLRSDEGSSASNNVPCSHLSNFMQIGKWNFGDNVFTGKILLPGST